MAASIVNNLSGHFIAEVVDYNVDTRELEVYIPKLMPGIANGQKQISVMTNMGNASVNIVTNPQIKIGSTIKVRARHFNEPIPEIGCKVLVKFLESRPEFGFWEAFDAEPDFEVIEPERYPKLGEIELGGKSFDINNKDRIEVELPKGFSVVRKEGNPKKVKTFTILDESNSNEKISRLEETVGLTNLNGQDLKEPEGLIKAINELKESLDKVNQYLYEYDRYTYPEIKDESYFIEKEETDSIIYYVNIGTETEPSYQDLRTYCDNLDLGNFDYDDEDDFYDFLKKNPSLELFQLVSSDSTLYKNCYSLDDDKLFYININGEFRPFNPLTRTNFLSILENNRVYIRVENKQDKNIINTIKSVIRDAFTKPDNEGTNELYSTFKSSVEEIIRTSSSNSGS